MKKSIVLFLFLNTTMFAQQGVGIGTITPNATAILDIESTAQGVILPRMTTAQRGVILTPEEGLTIYNSENKCLETFDGIDWISVCSGLIVTTIPCGDTTTVVVEVVSTTGRIWMDRNLGATQIATSSTDAAAYGDLYQWGRCAEGHEKRTSGVTATNATTAEPNTGAAWDGLFITEVVSPFDWLTPQNDTLWQGVSGINNPCPAGFRGPTSDEWNTEYTTWTSFNTAGAFASPLKLPAVNLRNYNIGTLDNVGTDGTYWSSTVSGT